MPQERLYGKQFFTLKLLAIKTLRASAIVITAMLCLYSSAVAQTKFANSDATIRSIAFDQRGRLWAGSFGRGLWVADETGITRFFDENAQQPHPMVNNLLFDGHYMWVATAGGGCIRIDTSLDQIVPVEQQAGFSKLHGLARTSSGTLIIGSVGSGSAYLADDRWVPVSNSQPVNLAWVNSIIEWQNRLWLGTSTGLYSTGSAVSDWRPQYEQLNRGVNHLAADHEKLLIATTRNGLYEKNPGKSPEKVSGIDGMIHFILPVDRQTLVIGDRATWVITDGAAVKVVNSVENAKCAAMDSKNRFFIGTTDGKIYVSDNGTNFSLKYFFSDNGLEENKE